MTFQLLLITMCSLTLGLGYLLKCFHRKEADILRMDRGLRKYVQSAQ